MTETSIYTTIGIVEPERRQYLTEADLRDFENSNIVKSFLDAIHSHVVLRAKAKNPASRPLSLTRYSHHEFTHSISAYIEKMSAPLAYTEPDESDYDALDQDVRSRSVEVEVPITDVTFADFARRDTLYITFITQMDIVTDDSLSINPHRRSM